MADKLGAVWVILVIAGCRPPGAATDEELFAEPDGEVEDAGGTDGLTFDDVANADTGKADTAKADAAKPDVLQTDTPAPDTPETHIPGADSAEVDGPHADSADEDTWEVDAADANSVDVDSATDGASGVDSAGQDMQIPPDDATDAALASDTPNLGDAFDAPDSADSPDAPDSTETPDATDAGPPDVLPSVCTVAELQACDDGKICTTDTCKPGQGCAHANVTGACEDGNPCTEAETCKFGLCLGGKPIDCGDGLPCTLDVCAIADGTCSHAPSPGPCDDGNLCTVGESCGGGACGGGQAAICQDGNACTLDTCANQTGCVFLPAGDTACDDGNPCTKEDSCGGGTCAGTVLTCLAADTCHSAGICDVNSGTCPSENAVDGKVCNDGLACTSGDVCTSGVCTGTSTCNDQDACTLDACQSSGACSHEPACTVGGQVTGLGQGTLQLSSGSHKATLSGDGGFVLSGGFANGQKYLVTLADAPTPTQPRCHLDAAYGTIAGVSVGDVHVQCGTCGNGQIDVDAVADVTVEWLSTTPSPSPNWLTCNLNGQPWLKADGASYDYFCASPAHEAVVSAPADLAKILPEGNVLQCSFPAELAWLVVTVHHVSGRLTSAVMYDAPGDLWGSTDGWRRNNACPNFGKLPAGSQVVFAGAATEACDDGNALDGDGCSAICHVEGACAPGSDSDGDGLDDCAETGSGTFVDAGHTGTSPWLFDTDNDGLGDGDEILGTSAGLDLPGLGAHPLRQDVFVEVDWMAENDDCALHSHQLPASAADLAIATFAASPHLNPDGSTGIALHLDYGQGGVYVGGNLAGNAKEFAPDIGPELAAVKEVHFAPERLGYFHYALIMHSLGPTAGGIGELNGDDFILAPGGCDTCFTCEGKGAEGHLYAEILVHELGHNLGLRHGGADDCNGKPAYPSVMNYRHAYFGIDQGCDDVPDGIIDFSRGSRPDLNEVKLNEADGVCGGFWLDWNKNKAVDPAVKKDLNPNYAMTCGGTYAVLTDSDDWAHLALHGVGDGWLGGSTPDVAAGQGTQAASGTFKRQAPIRCYDDPATVAKRRRPMRWP